MNCEDLSQTIKSCLWLNFFPYKIPLALLTSPPPVYTFFRNIRIRNFNDEFELYIVKATESIIRTVIYRNRLGLIGNLDPGYGFKFSFTINGFDEETQSAIMMYDDEKAGATFMLTEDILKKATSTHVIFDIFLVVHFLEFKSLDKNDTRKMKADLYTSLLKDKLKKQEFEQLGCILKNPEMKDVFTGRLSTPCMKKVVFAIAKISKNLSKLSEYFKAKYNDRDSKIPDFEVNKILNYIGLSDEEGPPPFYRAIQDYFAAHIIGLDCLKIAASDYMVHILEQDDNVLNVFVIALMVQDEYLVEKAILSFLNHFDEVIHSEIFKSLIEQKGHMARLVIHSTRMWVSNHNVFLPRWGQTALPTTEL